MTSAQLTHVAATAAVTTPGRGPGPATCSTGPDTAGPVPGELAGAGVGRLGIVDGDRLEPSNLHRQTWYALADCGREKAARWLTSENRALGGRTPISELDTDLGAEEVEAALQRLSHGIVG
mgnify:CR=1 FL=1